MRCNCARQSSDKSACIGQRYSQKFRLISDLAEHMTLLSQAHSVTCRPWHSGKPSRRWSLQPTKPGVGCEPSFLSIYFALCAGAQRNVRDAIPGAEEVLPGQHAPPVTSVRRKSGTAHQDGTPCSSSKLRPWRPHLHIACKPGVASSVQCGAVRAADCTTAGECLFSMQRLLLFQLFVTLWCAFVRQVWLWALLLAAPSCTELWCGVYR
jgi:hypothetical protein